jgi:hypothetical protein
MTHASASLETNLGWMMCLANSFKKTLSVLIVTEQTVPARADETHDRRVVERGGLPSANATGGAWALARALSTIRWGGGSGRRSVG